MRPEGSADDVAAARKRTLEGRAQAAWQSQKMEASGSDGRRSTIAAATGSRDVRGAARHGSRCLRGCKYFKATLYIQTHRVESLSYRSRESFRPKNATLHSKSGRGNSFEFVFRVSTARVRVFGV